MGNIGNITGIGKMNTGGGGGKLYGVGVMLQDIYASQSDITTVNIYFYSSQNITNRNDLINYLNTYGVGSSKAIRCYGEATNNSYKYLACIPRELRIHNGSLEVQFFTPGSSNIIYFDEMGTSTVIISCREV